ncbi:TlpA disulfide reductase family protein [Salipaludibacillus sp. HK11]|uniref:TlpA disulfide reductase family protein n=1 Tax=Salipaludibacillus sp. HK11 TaxID=3394320 RepID=UPI0039FDA495
MRVKQIFSIAIIIVAVGIGAIVIYDDRRETDANQKLLDEYLESGGIDDRENVNNDFEEYEERDEVGTQPGMLAKDFTLANLDGDKEPVKLSDFRGQYVVVNMWASWCPPCRDEMPDFVEFYENYKDEGVEMIGVNMATQERNMDAVQQFVDDFTVPFYIALDEEGAVLENYAVHVMPTTYIIDPDGRVAVNRPGFINYDILENYYKEIKENYEENLSS